MKPSSHLLRAGEKGIKQIKGDLARFKNKKVEGYCALGYLACRAGLIKNENSAHRVQYQDIYAHYGLTPYIGAEIFKMNDRGARWKTIARWLNERGY